MNSYQEIKFSDDNEYRYSFHQRWAMGQNIMFVGLNPSMPDGLNPTLNRCISFAKQWGYGGCYILNLFAYRASTPKLLKTVENPIGTENDLWLIETVAKVDKVIFAWGTNGNYLNRDKAVIELLHNAYCLELTKDGFPKHPLYVKSDVKPFLFV